MRKKVYDRPEGTLTSWGYYVKWLKGRGYIRMHRLVMEKHLGRELTRDEVVHHKDGNRRNNALENLELMTKKEHDAHHSGPRKINPNNTETHKQCRKCKQITERHNFGVDNSQWDKQMAYCFACAQEMCRNRRKRPSVTPG